MKKLLTATVMLLAIGSAPLLAQETETGGAPTVLITSDDTVNAMMGDWARYDEACRGTLPENGADGFCGARDYIGWALNESGICLAEDEAGGMLWEECADDSTRFDDPLAALKEDLAQ